jgi:Ran GTPase-activating protein (RanGAP) involved in mRNA processing and transport
MVFFRKLFEVRISENDPASFWPAVFRGQTSVDLFQKQISDKRMNQLASALEASKTIEHLSLIECNIGDDSFIKLGNAIAKHPSLKTLWLGKNNFRVMNFERFLVLIQNNLKLNNLDFNNNCLGTEGCITLCNFISVRPQYTALFFAGNYIGDAGAIHFAALISSQKNITSLYLCNNGITDTGANALLNALTIHNSVTSLNLDCNTISDNVLNKIDAQLEINRQMNTVYQIMKK